jgi:hypothetical protein
METDLIRSSSKRVVDDKEYFGGKLNKEEASTQQTKPREQDRDLFDLARKHAKVFVNSYK